MRRKLDHPFSRGCQTIERPAHQIRRLGRLPAIIHRAKVGKRRASPRWLGALCGRLAQIAAAPTVMGATVSRAPDFEVRVSVASAANGTRGTNRPGSNSLHESMRFKFKRQFTRATFSKRKSIQRFIIY